VFWASEEVPRSWGARAGAGAAPCLRGRSGTPRAVGSHPPWPWGGGGRILPPTAHVAAWWWDWAGTRVRAVCRFWLWVLFRAGRGWGRTETCPWIRVSGSRANFFYFLIIFKVKF
jgi:hypothetical protein